MRNSAIVKMSYLPVADPSVMHNFNHLKLIMSGIELYKAYVKYRKAKLKGDLMGQVDDNEEGNNSMDDSVSVVYTLQGGDTKKALNMFKEMVDLVREARVVDAKMQSEYLFDRVSL